MAARKPANLRQRRNQPKMRRSAAVEVVAQPEPPANLAPIVLEWWDEFWESDIAENMRRTDLPAINRLFLFYDEMEKTREAVHSPRVPPPTQSKKEPHNSYQKRFGEWARADAARGRLIMTGNGLKLNPLLRYMSQLAKDIKDLEDRFGFTLRSRQELGLNEIRARTLAEQNAAQDTPATATPVRGVKRNATDEDDDDPVAALEASIG